MEELFIPLIIAILKFKHQVKTSILYIMNNAKYSEEICSENKLNLTLCEPVDENFHGVDI